MKLIQNNAEYEENLSKAKSALEFLNSYMPKKSGIKSILKMIRKHLTIRGIRKNS